MILMMTMTYIVGFVLGAVIGSFLNVCIYRLPREESIVVPGSHCPRCGTPIRFYDNLPIVSYIVLRGKCRACSAQISWQYPLVELLMGMCSVLLLFRYGVSLSYVIYFVFCASLIVVSFVDLAHRIIPDEISLPGIGAGILAALVNPGLSITNAGLGMLVGGGSLYLVAMGYHLVTKREGMGGGDIKLLAMIGAFIGWKGVLFTILASSFIGALVGAGLMVATKDADGKYAVPFGPFLSLGALLYLFVGELSIRWYLGFLGGLGR
jgi:leader peptidase (prepilin peptidase)/N-methyltransferase